MKDITIMYRIIRQTYQKIYRVQHRQPMYREVARVNIREAASRLDLSPTTIRRWIKSGRLEATLIDGAYGEQYEITEEALQRAKEQENVPIVIQNTSQATERELQRAIEKVVGDTIANELETIRQELEDTRRALAEEREKDRARQEQRDRQLMKVMREIQERQEQEATPWYKRILKRR